MAPVISAKRFIELCDKWSIKHIPIKANWATHNRAGHGEFGDMRGIGIHHTGSHASVADQESILWNGVANLPGPLCHAGIDPAGILRLAGWGRTNHFGLGSSAVLKHVIAEDYTGVLKPGPATIDGNAHFYGFEIMYDGTHAMTDAQRITAVRVSAMLCTEHKWTEKSAIGHGEWQQGKWDPGYQGHMIAMDKFRDEVKQAQMEGPPKKLPTRPPAPKPVPKPATTVTVKKGDTLMGLAEKYLGDQSRWIDFVKANARIVIIKDGDVLNIPKK